MSEAEWQTSIRPSGKVPVSLSSFQQIVDRIACKKRQEKVRRWGAFLCSLFLHFILLAILASTISRFYRVKINLSDAEAIQISNFFPPLKLASFDTPFEREHIRNITNRKLLIPQLDNNILALNKKVISPGGKRGKRIGLERKDPRQVQLEKKIEYHQGWGPPDSLPVIQKRIFYEDKLTAISRAEKAEVFITVNLPQGNKTSYREFTLSGSIKPNVEKAFLMVNNNAQPLSLYSEHFIACVNLKKGLNKFTILALTHEGGMGIKSFHLLFSPTTSGPTIALILPENGQQGIKAGQVVWVEGIISDRTITEATLFVNKVPMNIEVTNGIFRREVLATKTKINTFQVMAVGKDGVQGYSSQHTVLADHGIEISGRERKNPQPY